MNKLIHFLIFISIIGCTKEPEYNNYTEIIHYKITNKDAYKVDSINEFLGILGLNGNHTIRFSKIESELSGYGFKKINIIDGKVKSIDSIITNNLIYETNLIACSPIYRDILILKKKKQIVGVLKLCFECNIAERYGKLKSTFNETNLDDNNVTKKHFSNFNNLYKLLYNKEYVEDIYIHRNIRFLNKNQNNQPPKNRNSFYPKT